MKWSVQSHGFYPTDDSNAKAAPQAEEIVAKLPQVDVLISRGRNLLEAIPCSQHNFTTGTPT